MDLLDYSGDIDPRVALIPNDATELHRHLCGALAHPGDRQWECQSPHCLRSEVMTCIPCSGGIKSANHPHRLVRWVTSHGSEASHPDQQHRAYGA
jgi:hypothetical protein